jgi:hypothetical protein
MNQEYNGWTNRDTWLVALWIENDAYNYNWVKQNASSLLKKNKTQLLILLNVYLKIEDNVNWSKVNVSEIKNMVIKGINH